MEIWELGPMSPFWSLSTVLGSQYDQVGAFDVPISKMLVDMVIGFAGTPFGSSGTPKEPYKGTFGSKGPEGTRYHILID